MRILTTIFIGLVCFILSSCGGGGSSGSAQPLRSDQTTDANPETEALVEISFNGFNPETTNLRFNEGEMITFEIVRFNPGVTTASLSQTAGPAINFGAFESFGEMSETDLDTTDSSNSTDTLRFTLNDVEGQRTAVIDRFDRLRVTFRAPSVTTGTTLIFRFQSSGTTGSRTRNIPIVIEDDATVLTLNGRVSKGLVTNTEIELFSVDRLTIIFNGNREIVEPVNIDETGGYNFTVLPATDLEELLRFEVEGDGADMICDAPMGCNDAAFGEFFEVEDDLDLRALIPVPPFGTTRTANINIMTTLVVSRAGSLNGLRRINLQDVEDSREDVASVFGIRNQDYSTVPFIDITQPFTSTNEDAIRLAMISGGILGATFLHSDPDDDEDYLEELDDFIDEFGDREVFCRDAEDQRTLSIEDVMSQALEISRIHSDALTQRFFQDRLAAIRNGSFDCQFITPPPPSTE